VVFPKNEEDDFAIDIAGVKTNSVELYLAIPAGLVDIEVISAPIVPIVFPNAIFRAVPCTSGVAYLSASTSVCASNAAVKAGIEQKSNISLRIVMY
jgi:hypothetical protein